MLAHSDEGGYEADNLSAGSETNNTHSPISTQLRHLWETCPAHGFSTSYLHTPVLPSLTSHPSFKLQSWLTLPVDGLRIDTVKHVEPDFWTIFNSASGIYNVGEVADGNVDYVCPYQNSMDGVLAYPTWVPKSFYQILAIKYFLTLWEAKLTDPAITKPRNSSLTHQPHPRTSWMSLMPWMGNAGIRRYWAPSRKITIRRDSRLILAMSL